MGWPYHWRLIRVYRKRLTIRLRRHSSASHSNKLILSCGKRPLLQPATREISDTNGTERCAVPCRSVDRRPRTDICAGGRDATRDAGRTDRGRLPWATAHECNLRGGTRNDGARGSLE